MANYTLNYTGEKVDELLNKIDTAFGEEIVNGDTLTWDGDMTGKPVVTLDAGDGTVMNFCKVSDAVPTLEDFSDGVSATLPSMGTQEVTADMVTVGDGYIFALVVAIISKPNTLIDGVGATFPETGVWLVNQSGTYISEFKINGYTGFEAVKVIPLPSKYLPKADVVFSWDVTGNVGITCNKTFAELSGMSQEELLNAVLVITSNIGRSGMMRAISVIALARDSIVFGFNGASESSTEIHSVSIAMDGTITHSSVNVQQN